MNAPVVPSSPEPSPPLRPGHETTDVSTVAVSLSALALVLMIAIVLPLLAWFCSSLDEVAARHDPQSSPVAADQTPPLPRLQSDSVAELAAFRAAQEKQATTYGWSDGEQKIVRIPISRAMELLAERGIPEPEGPFVPPRAEERAR